MKADFTFMSSGPMFSFELPDSFTPTPHLSSPLLNGRGGRAFDFVPRDQDPGMDPDDGTLVGTLTDRDGRPVELYERDDPPQLWWLRWPLAGGALYTHLREEDGVDFAETTVKSISIHETSTGTPFLLPEKPLEFGASATPAYQELATYLAPSLGELWSLTFQRPGFVPEGRLMRSPERGPDGQVAMRAGARFGVDIHLTAPSSSTGNDVMSTVKDSLRGG